MDFNDAGRLNARVEEIRLDTDTGKASRRVIADIACEFPVVPAHLLGAHLLAPDHMGLPYTGCGALQLQSMHAIFFLAMNRALICPLGHREGPAAD